MLNVSFLHLICFPCKNSISSKKRLKCFRYTSSKIVDDYFRRNQRKSYFYREGKIFPSYKFRRDNNMIPCIQITDTKHRDISHLCHLNSTNRQHDALNVHIYVQHLKLFIDILTSSNTSFH